jgi:hypothetical protein
VDRQTDRHTKKLIAAFGNFAKVPKKKQGFGERELAEPSVWCRLPFTQEHIM